MARIIKKDEVKQRELLITKIFQGLINLTGKQFDINYQDFRMIVKLRLNDVYTYEDFQKVITL